jgi:hypothetical protein
MLDTTPEQEELIEEYIEQGFTREEAQLIVFEDTHGKIEGQGMIRQALPSVRKPGEQRQADSNKRMSVALGQSPSRDNLGGSGPIAGLGASPLASTSGNHAKFMRKQSFVGDMNSISVGALQPTNAFTRAEEAELSYIMSRGMSREEAVAVFLKNHNSRVTEQIQSNPGMARNRLSTDNSGGRSPANSARGGGSNVGTPPPQYQGGGLGSSYRVNSGSALNRGYDNDGGSGYGEPSGGGGSSKYSAGGLSSSSAGAVDRGRFTAPSNGSGRLNNTGGRSAAAQLFAAETASNVSGASNSQPLQPGPSRYSNAPNPSSKHHRIGSTAPNFGPPAGANPGR